MSQAQPAMIAISLVLNIAVLVPVCVGLRSNAKWTRACYGDNTPARQILLSIYVAIGLVSLLLLFANEPKLVAALLLVQVVYKVTTPITVGKFTNPVVVSNLGIAVFHTITLLLIWQMEFAIPATEL